MLSSKISTWTKLVTYRHITKRDILNCKKLINILNCKKLIELSERPCTFIYKPEKEVRKEN